MAKPTRSMTTLVSLATLTLVVVALYFGRPVLMPLALAVLLSFLLSPVADALHRLGVGRKTSVVFLNLRENLPPFRSQPSTIDAYATT